MIRLMIVMVLLSVAAVSSQPAPRVTPRPLSYIYSQKVSKAATIDELSSILNDAFDTLFSIGDDAVPNLYSKAEGYLNNAKSRIAKSGNTSAAKAVFSACSLKTLAAVMQLVHAGYERELRHILEQRNETQRMIKLERERICERVNSGNSTFNKKFKDIRSPQIQIKSDSRSTVISVSDILFKTDSAALTPNLISSLSRFAKIVQSSPDYRLIIEGHTDNRGLESYNKYLSEQRARNVLQFLAKQGISPDRMTAKGYGMSRPIADNETAIGRKKNRRVDIVVQENEPATASDR